MRQFCLILYCFVVAVPCSSAIEHVTVERNGKSLQLAGRIEVEAQDGGLLLLHRDGTLWALQPEEIQKRRTDDEPFRRLDRESLVQELKSELPEGFNVHKTAHYVIMYNTSRAYAQWCGSLYERLYRGFYNYWRKRGLELHDPETALVAIVFDRPSEYTSYSRDELGDAAESIVGYYSLRTNRVATYDLTGRGDLRTARGRPNSAAVINQVLSQPAAEPTVATIIHEATHQLAYNSGLQTRYADNPLWLSEGLAIFFETPDLKSSKGWRNIGGVHQRRLLQLRNDLPGRSDDALEQLLTNDAQLRSADTAAGGYAESWGLCYFLAKRHPKAFASFLQELSEKPPLGQDTPAQRLAAFRRHLGDDLQSLDKQFVRFMREL